jgi:hypothetical protein
MIGRFKQVMSHKDRMAPSFTTEEAGHLYAHQTMQKMGVGRATRDANLHLDYLNLLHVQSYDNYTAPRIDCLLRGAEAPTREMVRDAVHHIRLRLYYEILGLETIRNIDTYKHLRRSKVVKSYQEFHEFKKTDAYSPIKIALESEAFQRTATHWRTKSLNPKKDLRMIYETAWDRFFFFALWGSNNFSGHPELPLTLLKEKLDQKAFTQPLVRDIAQKIVAAGEYFYGRTATYCPKVRDFAYDLTPQPTTLPKRNLG